MIWLYSLRTNITQGEYETCCVQETSLRQLNTLHPHIDTIDFFSDASDGYKSTPTILGLRYAKETTGIRGRKPHFNAFGEGKRCETHGQNTDTKSRRESTMRAGESTGCVTLAQAQLRSDGILDYPVVLDFDYERVLRECYRFTSFIYTRTGK
jgi:hypothetical protein